MSLVKLEPLKHLLMTHLLGYPNQYPRAKWESRRHTTIGKSLGFWAAFLTSFSKEPWDTFIF